MSLYNPSEPKTRKRDAGELQNTQIAFFDNQFDFWNANIGDTQDAIAMAHTDYTKIFENKTLPSLKGAVFLQLFVTLTCGCARIYSSSLYF